MGSDIKIALSISLERSNFSPLLFAGDLNNGISAAAGLGYDGVEISIRDADKVDQGKIASALDKYGIRAYSIATGQSFFTDGYSFSSADKDNRKIAVKRMKGHVNLASVLDCNLVVGGILGNVRTKYGTGSDLEKRILNCFREFAEYAKEKNVVILFEPINFYLTYFICTLDEGKNFIKSLGFDNIELLPDTHHMHIEEKSITDSLKDHIDLINYIHFSDSNRQAPGFGNIDYQSIIKTFKQQGFSGVISFEILPIPDDMAAAEQAIKYIRNLLDKDG